MSLNSANISMQTALTAKVIIRQNLLYPHEVQHFWNSTKYIRCWKQLNRSSNHYCSNILILFSASIVVGPCSSKPFLQRQLKLFNKPIYKFKWLLSIICVLMVALHYLCVDTLIPDQVTLFTECLITHITQIWPLHNIFHCHVSMFISTLYGFDIGSLTQSFFFFDSVQCLKLLKQFKTQCFRS